MTLRVRIEGDKKVIRSLGTAKRRVSNLTEAWRTIGRSMRQDAIRYVPVLTGRLASTIRDTQGRNRATVRAGGPGIPPYAHVIHWGGYNNIEPHPFLTRALQRNESKASKTIENELQDVFRSLNLD